MKCIINIKTKKVSRVSDAMADRAVKSGEANFCPKKLWKEQRNEAR